MLNKPLIKNLYRAKVFIIFKRLNQKVERAGIGMTISKKMIVNRGDRIGVKGEEGKSFPNKVHLKV